MPDFTHELHSQCKNQTESNLGGYEQFWSGYYPWCTCPAYKHGEDSVSMYGEMYPKLCKHLLEFEKSRCQWHSMDSGEKQVEDGICPICGDETELVRVAV